jgi:hypothetical protein
MGVTGSCKGKGAKGRMAKCLPMHAHMSSRLGTTAWDTTAKSSTSEGTKKRPGDSRHTEDVTPIGKQPVFVNKENYFTYMKSIG